MKANNVNLHRDIIQDCLDGQPNGYEKLYKLYSRAMYNVCFRIVNDRDDAEDVMQEAFVNAFNNLKSYKGDASFGAWLKRIMINMAINFVKKKHLETVSLDSQFENLSDEEAKPEPVYSVETIHKAIQQLPDGYRMVFSLYLLEGYDHSEIAEILDITESTSRSQYNRSKNKLRELIKNNNGKG